MKVNARDPAYAHKIMTQYAVRMDRPTQIPAAQDVLK